MLPAAAVFTCLMLVVSAHLAALVADGALAPEGAARPNAGAVVRCSPAPATGPVGGVLAVDIFIADVSALYGADVRLSFDTAIAQVVDADGAMPGDQIQPLSGFLSPDFVIRKVADNTAGTIWYAVTQVNPSDAVSGSGSIARISFRALKPGAFTMPITYHKLAARDGSEIAAGTQSCLVSFTADDTATPTATKTLTPRVTWTPTPTGSATLTVTPTATASATPSPTPTALATTPTLEGVVYFDRNRNGRRDAGEEGLAGVLLMVFQLPNEESRPGPAGALTSEDLARLEGAASWSRVTGTGGYFRVRDLPAGFDFAVLEYDPFGYTSTTPNVVLVNIPASTGGATFRVEFGDWQAVYSRLLYLPLVLR